MNLPECLRLRGHGRSEFKQFYAFLKGLGSLISPLEPKWAPFTFLATLGSSEFRVMKFWFQAFGA